MMEYLNLDNLAEFKEESSRSMGKTEAEEELKISKILGLHAKV